MCPPPRGDDAIVDANDFGVIRGWWGRLIVWGGITPGKALPKWGPPEGFSWMGEGDWCRLLLGDIESKNEWWLILYKLAIANLKICIFKAYLLYNLGISVVNCPTVRQTITS